MWQLPFRKLREERLSFKIFLIWQRQHRTIQHELPSYTLFDVAPLLGLRCTGKEVSKACIVHTPPVQYIQDFNLQWWQSGMVHKHSIVNGADARIATQSPKSIWFLLSQQHMQVYNTYSPTQGIKFIPGVSNSINIKDEFGLDFLNGRATRNYSERINELHPF